MLNAPSKLKEDRTKSSYKIIEEVLGDLGKSHRSGVAVRSRASIQQAECVVQAQSCLTLCIRSGSERIENASWSAQGPEGVSQLKRQRKISAENTPCT